MYCKFYNIELNYKKSKIKKKFIRKIVILVVYIKRIQKVSYCFFYIKNTSKLINQQLKNVVKIVN